jgi:biopolymer transport protein ExbB
MEAIKLSVDYAIFGILGFMSLLALTYALERWWFYKSVNLEAYKVEELLENDLTKNLTALSIISSNAPYVGLLGTVIGVMITFYDMGQVGDIDSKVILIGLSLALKATALGLVVAIPSLMVYTACLRKCDVLMGKWKAIHAT